MAKRTSLYDWHVAHGARMVDFAGWDMPIQYTSIIEEHQAVRMAAGLFDISHMGRLSFVGSDSLALIQEVFTNDAATLQEGQVRYGLLCNENGGILDDVLVYRWPSGFTMVVNASNRAKVLAWLLDHKKGRTVEVNDRTEATSMVAIQGPRALELARGLTLVEAEKLAYYHAAPSTYLGQQCFVSRTGYTGEDGLEFMVAADQGNTLWQELTARGARACGLGARDTLRLEAAMPLYGHELSEEIDPFQAGLGWAVKMDKGDFIGRSALARRRQDAILPRRIGLELEGKRIAREGSAVFGDGQEVGRVSSGTFAPTLNRAIAMAYVDLFRTVPETAWAVDVRGKSIAARVVPLPFYRRLKKG